jgi:peptide chain release factor 1
MDSKLFVRDLYDAYNKYAKSLGLKVEELYLGDGHIIANVKGKGAGKAFQYEAGKHTVQRVPPTEHKGRRHTSIVSVAVLPMRPDVEKNLNLSDVEIMTTKGTGPGGQHKNKTESAVRAKHLPTGITVFIDGRKQHQNKREALRILATRVNEHYKQSVDASYDKKRRQQLGGGGRSNKIRTYNFIKDRAVDHRLNIKCKRVEEIIYRGRFDLLLKKVKD